jgi:hypothetical protein
VSCSGICDGCQQLLLVQGGERGEQPREETYTRGECARESAQRQSGSCHPLHRLSKWCGGIAPPHIRACKALFFCETT